MSETSRRIDALARQASVLEPWVGKYDGELLREWLGKELGHPEALEEWVPHGSILSKAVALSPVLHVVSGNTPHAAFQSVFRGLLAGCMNRVKLPGEGLPAFEEWIEGLPEILAKRIEVRRDLPAEWLECEAAVIFGGQSTIDAFRSMLPPGVRRIEHGPKWSVAVVFEPTREAADRVAADVLRHDQRGCLSVQAVFVEGDAREFGDLLAAALERFCERGERGTPSISESGGVFNARELARFRIANGEPMKLWESKGSTAWTVLCNPDPTLVPGPLNGFVSVHPLPEKFDAETLGGEAELLSTVAVFPLTPANAEKISMLAPPRICDARKSPGPALSRPHNGGQTLAELVRWRDIG